MADYTVRFDSRAYPHDRDAKGVNVLVEKDGGYFQFVLASVDGMALVTEYRDVDVDSDEFWSGVARAAVPLLESAVRRGDVPLDDPGHAFEVQPQHVKPSGDVLTFGDVVGEFTA